MNKILFRLSLAAAVTLGMAALAMTAHAQEPSTQEPTATAPPQQDPAGMPPQDRQTPTASPSRSGQSQNEAQMPTAGTDTQTQDAKAFTGRVVKEDGKVVLKDPVTKNTYQLDDASKVKSYMGKQVKVSGKLDMNSNTIHVDSIEPLTTD
jgi:hypothetical protein